MRPLPAARRYLRAPAAGALLACALPGQAMAHAFGARYDLPLPLALYLAAAGTAVALSFVVLALLLSPPRAPRERAAAAPAAPASAPGSGWLALARALALALLGVVVLAAFVGEASPTRNFASVFVWIIWWVGFAYLQALLIDVWSWLNPWQTLAARVRPTSGARIRYPDALGHWPAVALFLAFAWLELVSDLGEQPRTLGILILGYGALTLLAAWLFGVRAWFEFGDPFTAVFRILGRFAPLGFDSARRRLAVRAPGHALLTEQPVSTSMVVLVVCLLTTVSFDGFLETPTWAALLEWVSASSTLRAPLLALQGAGADLLELVKSLALALAVTLFVAVFVIVAWLVDRLSGAPRGVRASAGHYVLTLVPIAIGYHLAHYLSYLLIAGQLIVPLVSDPFGLGWDLFATRGYSIDIAIVDARFVWYTAVVAVIAGHVIAVYLAHATALRLYGQRRAAVRSQLPMLVLMVGYTMISLWILSQPIVQ